MVIDIRRLFDIEGETVPLTYSLDLSDVEHWGVHPFNRPINLQGEIKSKTGIVTISYKADISTSLPCDRCLTDVRKECSLNFKHTLVRKLYNEEADESYILIENGMLDLTELATSDIVLELP
ncbi:MAG: YceD family protein, partial [Oscillospiraceae bacterium]